MGYPRQGDDGRTWPHAAERDDADTRSLPCKSALKPAAAACRLRLSRQQIGNPLEHALSDATRDCGGRTQAGAWSIFLEIVRTVIAAVQDGASRRPRNRAFPARRFGKYRETFTMRTPPRRGESSVAEPVRGRRFPGPADATLRSPQMAPRKPPFRSSASSAKGKGR
jgi:hypothetical protein